MTNEEMERSIIFLLDSQASLTASVEKLTEDIAQMKIQADADRAEMRNGFNALGAAILQAMDNADADRRLMREMFQDIKGFVYQVDAKATDAVKGVRELKKEKSEPGPGESE